ncbi:MAG: hypothetical protein ACRD3V_04860 [Vicinamibacteria bacterium]
MDVVTHHTTVAGDFAMTRSQWLIIGVDKNGKRTEVHHHGMEVHRRLPDGSWVFFLDHPSGADPTWAVERPPHTEQLTPAISAETPRSAAPFHIPRRTLLAHKAAGIS